MWPLVLRLTVEASILALLPIATSVSRFTTVSLCVAAASNRPPDAETTLNPLTANLRTRLFALISTLFAAILTPSPIPT